MRFLDGFGRKEATVDLLLGPDLAERGGRLGDRLGKVDEWLVVLESSVRGRGMKSGGRGPSLESEAFGERCVLSARRYRLRGHFSFIYCPLCER